MSVISRLFKAASLQISKSKPWEKLNISNMSSKTRPTKGSSTSPYFEDNQNRLTRSQQAKLLLSGADKNESRSKSAPETTGSKPRISKLKRPYAPVIIGFLQSIFDHWIRIVTFREIGQS